ncbi:DUF1177 domain-containing protein [Paenacidovorax monticola]|uniref:DUF1177 domain-containing protein n=1 Tax=Paenacidovorax monticola TaxID=1926868 RepID=A0A7H0HDU1_9BURK|nr:DUF1177 domain-containing protein [Paenacidovorax monticola]QNP58707.1 DUF1177 domain-containing protein [Paenacidovorax monticola]
MQHVSSMIDLLSSAHVTGEDVAAHLRALGDCHVAVTTLARDGATTDFLSIEIPGLDASAPRLGLVGRLGGIGARPAVSGLVSDSDGAVVVLAAAAKMLDMARRGDPLPAPVHIHTHICPRAGTRPHHPVPMMRSPFPMREMMAHEVSPRMDAILSVDTTRGNRLVNHRGVALTPVAKEGWLLPIPDLMLDVMGWVSGELPVTLPLTTQDITPYENGLPHVNSIMQPAIVTPAPVVGVALTAQTTVPGCATGVTNAWDADVAMRFCIEIAKLFGQRTLSFVNEDHWRQLQARYGSLAHLQGVGREPA